MFAHMELGGSVNRETTVFPRSRPPGKPLALADGAGGHGGSVPAGKGHPGTHAGCCQPGHPLHST